MASAIRWVCKPDYPTQVSIQRWNTLPQLEREGRNEVAPYKYVPIGDTNTIANSCPAMERSLAKYPIAQLRGTVFV
jgi:hypothetical protein